MKLYKEFRFEAAHRLTCVSNDHPCARVHGHSYRVRLVFNGPIDCAMGWVFDWGVLIEPISACMAEVDHHFLNDVKGLENPTCENLAAWIFKRFMGRAKASFVDLESVEVQENPTSGVIYTEKDRQREVDDALEIEVMKER